MGKNANIDWNTITNSVLCLCVNYHNEEDTKNFVLNFLGQDSSEFLQIIVVDNSEREFIDTPLSCLLEADPRVRIMKAKCNLGYFGGAAWGLQEHLTGLPLTDWVIVSNTDIVIKRDFLMKLFTFYPNGAYGVIAPSIISSRSGADQNPFMIQRPSKYRMHFYKWIFRYYPSFVAYQVLALLKDKMKVLFTKLVRLIGKQEVIARQRPRHVYAPHGSFIVFHRSYFEAGGNLNHGVLLFGEEVFVAETARRLGLTIIYDPRLSVLHREHATTGIFKNPKIARHVREASAYCADTFFLAEGLLGKR